MGTRLIVVCIVAITSTDRVKKSVKNYTGIHQIILGMSRVDSLIF